MSQNNHNENQIDGRRMTDGKILPFRKVEEHVSWDIRQDVQDIQRMIESGEVVGMAYVIVKKRFDYEIGVTGSCVTNPELTNGFLSQLMWRINQHAHNK